MQLLQDAKAQRQQFLATTTVGMAWTSPLLTEIAYTQLDTLEMLAWAHDSLNPEVEDTQADPAHDDR